MTPNLEFGYKLYLIWHISAGEFEARAIGAWQQGASDDDGSPHQSAKRSPQVEVRPGMKHGIGPLDN